MWHRARTINNHLYIYIAICMIFWISIHLTLCAVFLYRRHGVYMRGLAYPVVWHRHHQVKSSQLFGVYIIYISTEFSVWSWIYTSIANRMVRSQKSKLIDWMLASPHITGKRVGLMGFVRCFLVRWAEKGVCCECENVRQNQSLKRRIGKVVVWCIRNRLVWLYVGLNRNLY